MCTHTHPNSFIHTPHTWSLSYTGTHTHTYSVTHRMSFLIAVVTNCHELGDLLSGRSGGQESPGVSPGQDQGCIPSGGSPSPSSIFTPGDNRQSASPVTAARPLLPLPPLTAKDPPPRDDIEPPGEPPISRSAVRNLHPISSLNSLSPH